MEQSKTIGTLPIRELNQSIIIYTIYHYEKFSYHASYGTEP